MLWTAFCWSSAWHQLHGLRRKAVIDRAIAVACLHLCAGLQGCAHIGARQLHGLRQILAQSQKRRNGLRQGAARAMGVAGVDFLVGKHMLAAIGQHQDVANGIARQMPAFDQHRPCARAQQLMRRRAHVFG